MKKTSLPIRSALVPHYVLSITLALAASAAAILGLLLPEVVYPNLAARNAYVPTDMATLILGVPFILVSLLAASRRTVLGLLAWPGAIFYTLYTYVPYLISLPFGPAWPLHAVIVGLGAYGLAALLTCIDGEDVAERFGSETVVRPAAGVAIGLGLFLLLRTIGLAASALLRGADPGRIELSLWVTDLLIATPALVVSGLTLWRRRALGFKAAPGTLLAYVLLVAGVIPIYAGQSASATGSPDIAGIVILGAMALACAIPLGAMVGSYLSRPGRDS